MAKCLDCECIYATYGGSKGTSCPNCKSENIDISKETVSHHDKHEINIQETDTKLYYEVSGWRAYSKLGESYND